MPWPHRPNSKMRSQQPNFCRRLDACQQLVAERRINCDGEFETSKTAALNPRFQLLIPRYEKGLERVFWITNTRIPLGHSAVMVPL